MHSVYRGSIGTMALFVAAPLFAQEFRAGITGIVRDVQSAAMPEAKSKQPTSRPMRSAGR